MENYFDLKDTLPYEKNFQSKEKQKHTCTHLYTHLHTHTHTHTHTRTSGPNQKRKESTLKEWNGHPLIHSKQCPP